MKVIDELIEAMKDRAMGAQATADFLDARRRCCRCRWLDKESWDCTNEESEMAWHQLASPEGFGCVLFED